MSPTDIEPLVFTVPLALSAHEQASRLQKQHPSREKQKQVYLNSLAVYAVNYYLRCLGLETDYNSDEDSQNAPWQTLMDTADLVVVGYGSLECRPLQRGDKNLYIPPEVWSERLGFMAVELDESLTEATLIGFIDRVEQSEIPLGELRSLEEFSDYLESREKPEAVTALIHLGQWLENLVQSGWQELQELLQTPQTAMNFRWTQALEPQSHDFPIISRGKTLNFSNLDSLLLMVGLIPRNEAEQEIWVKIISQDSSEILPADLELMILDDQGEVIMTTDTQETSSILLKFTGDKDEKFSIKVLLAGESQTSTFII